MSQLCFDTLLAAADQHNRDRAFERKTGHLPSGMDDGMRVFRTMIAQHHQAMMDADIQSVMAIREQARMLARRLNAGEIGYLAQGAPGRILESGTRADDGTIPLWGQTGSFVITVQEMRVRIELGGIFSLASSVSYWPGFCAHIVDHGQPFFNDTGYRSFLGLEADAAPGMAPDEFTATMIAQCIEAQRSARKRR